MPDIQELHDQTKDQQDTLVLTLNLDNNIGLVEPYLKKEKFSFPVVLGHSLANRINPSGAIPRNWIVDQGGVVRRELLGLTSGDEAAEQVIEMMREVRDSTE